MLPSFILQRLSAALETITTGQEMDFRKNRSYTDNVITALLIIVEQSLLASACQLSRLSEGFLQYGPYYNLEDATLLWYLREIYYLHQGIVHRFLDQSGP